MILADKIINLRKKNGMSQEDLAEKIGVSRQAVSKWEGAQSIPDLDKIILMSSLFGVSTDFLLKDEMEEDVEEYHETVENNPKKVTMAMANEYIGIYNKTSKYIALGVLLCILSPVPLINLGVIAEQWGKNETLMGMLGLVFLIILVTIAIALFCIAGHKSKEYEFISNTIFETEYGVIGLVNEKKKKFQDSYFRNTLIGIILCVLSVIPLFIGLASEKDVYAILGLTICFVIVSIGVFLIVLVGCKMGAISRLLQEGDYSKKNKEVPPKLVEAISTCYWCLATVIYLVWSFLTNDWHITWIVWVVAAVLYGGVFPILQALTQKKK